MAGLDESSSEQKYSPIEVGREAWGGTWALWMAIIAMLILVHLAHGVFQYSQLRSDALSRHISMVQLSVDRAVISQKLEFDQAPTIAAFVARVENLPSISRVHLFDRVDLIGGSTEMANAQLVYGLHKQLIESVATARIFSDAMPLSLEWLNSLLKPQEYRLATAYQVLDRQQRRGVVVAYLDVSRALDEVLFPSARLYAGSTLAALLALLLLLGMWRTRRKYITPQQMSIDSRTERLEALLEEARAHHKAIRAAGSHAVQLNQQFLRKIGSDLHDGPAQQISYAVLRLREYKKEVVDELVGFEHYAIVESLEAALKEIRDISTGLVLPELEKMTMQQCVSKVIAQHRVLHPDMEIEELTSDLNFDADLGLKICVYRFIQEGLNNAARHGQASRCKISANVMHGVMRISLKDDGMGFRVSKLDSDHSRLGVIGLRDRIESIGGKFNINSVLGVGTALKMSFDLGQGSERPVEGSTDATAQAKS